jgi:hypothetical protein
MMKLLVENVKPVLWRLCKFMVDDRDGADAIKILLLPTDEWPKYAGLPDWEQLEICQAFWEIYGHDISKELNSSRTNTLNGVRKAYIDAMKDGSIPPNPEQLLRLVCRRGLKFDPKNPKMNEAERFWFRWYIDDLLPKIAGKDNWSTNIRHFHTPTTAMIPDAKPPAKFITSGTEAFVVLAVENAHSRWVLERQMIDSGQDPKKALDIVNNVIHKRDWPTKYTDQRVGKAKFGGWTTEARKRFEVLEKEISGDRSKKWAKAAENRCLHELQIDKGILERLANKKKGKKVVVQSQEELDLARVPFGQETDDEATGVSDDEEEEEDEVENPAPLAVKPAAKAKAPAPAPENPDPAAGKPADGDPANQNEDPAVGETSEHDEDEEEEGE